jgi:hypothetical protein
LRLVTRPLTARLSVVASAVRTEADRAPAGVFEADKGSRRLRRELHNVA